MELDWPEWLGSGEFSGENRILVIWLGVQELARGLETPQGQRPGTRSQYTAELGNINITCLNTLGGQ